MSKKSKRAVKLKEGSKKEEAGESKAKEQAEIKAGIDKAPDNKAANAKQMPAGSPFAPGPTNDPSDHPIDTVPQPTVPRWGQQAGSDPMDNPQGMGFNG